MSELMNKVSKENIRASMNLIFTQMKFLSMLLDLAQDTPTACETLTVTAEGLFDYDNGSSGNYSGNGYSGSYYGCGTIVLVVIIIVAVAIIAGILFLFGVFKNGFWAGLGDILMFFLRLIWSIISFIGKTIWGFLTWIFHLIFG